MSWPSAKPSPVLTPLLSRIVVWVIGISVLTKVVVIGFMASILFARLAHAGEVTSSSSSDWVTRSWQTGHGPPQNTVNAILRPRNACRIAASEGQPPGTELPAGLAFAVQAHFWEPSWFQSGAAYLFIGGSALTVWWLLRRKHLRTLAELERTRAHEAELAHAGRVMLLGELSASIAHELKQPLTAILSNAQAALRFLKDGPGQENEVRAILTDIAEADRRASEIISRMRALVKKGAAQVESRDINADIEHVLSLLHSDLLTRNISVATQLAPDLPPISGDHIQLQQVLLNLIVNGCDAMHATPPDERCLRIETERDDSGLVRVSVVDRGAGIAPEKLEHIFDPFFTTKDTGLGMGLAICRSIINAHHGRLWASNNPDQGATFHFNLTAGNGKPA